jgi:hypothetical protein
MREMTHADFAKGTAGATTAIASAFVSLLPQLETGLRIASLLLGCAVGLVTLVGLLRKKNRKRK